MKAIVYEEYGPPDVLQFTDAPKPVPTDNQVLIKVGASSINSADEKAMTGKPFMVRPTMGGLSKPKKTTLGCDVAGVVEAIGKNVSRFKVGDQVFGDLSNAGFGAFAEYVCAPENVLAHKPENCSFAQAAASGMAAVTALQGLVTVGRIRAGDKVLVNGASSGVGMFAVQIARAYGGKVTAVCSAAKSEMLRTLGVDRIIDNGRQDWTKTGDVYDLVLDLAAFGPFKDYKSMLAEGGRYVLAGGSTGKLFHTMFLGRWATIGSSRSIKILIAVVKQQDLQTIADLLQAKKIVPYVDKTYPLSQAADAFRYLGSRQVKGKLVLVP